MTSSLNRSSFVSELSANVKDSLSSSFSMMTTRQKRRNKKLRRQTGTIDISYATDYYPEPIASSSALSELSDSETGLDRMGDFDGIDDDLSETISGATRTGSIETFDRLSVLSDSVPELLDADSLSEISLGLAKEPASSASSADAAAPSGSSDGWRVIPIQIIPCTEIVIERCEQQVCSTANTSPKNDSLNTSSNSVISEKRKSVSPAVHPEADLIEVLGSVGCDDIQDDVDDTPVVANVVVDRVPSASVPATPMSEDRKRSKKSKLSMTSPATSLLEKSASWLSSLSGSKMGNGGKDKKMSKSLRTTKKSLTSLFEAVASSNNNNNNTNRSKQTKM